MQVRTHDGQDKVLRRNSNPNQLSHFLLVSNCVILNFIFRWMYRYHAVLLRDRFDKNAGVADMRQAKTLLEDGEQELWDKFHPQRIRFPMDPGGVAYARGPKHPDNVSYIWHIIYAGLCHHQRDILYSSNE